MDEEDEDPHQPLVCQVAEDDQEDRESVVQRVLEKVALGTDEKVSEEATEMFAELRDVVHFHLEGCVGDSGNDLYHRVGRPESAEPCGHEVRAYEYLVGPERADEVVDDRVPPLDQSEAAPFAGLGVGVSLLGDVVLFAESIEAVMDEPVDYLSVGGGTVKTKA